MRKFLLFALVIFMVGSVMEMTATEFGGGTGTSEDPFIVNSAEHLNNVRNYLGSENIDKYFKQESDIDLGIAPWNESEGWIPIGSGTMHFYGNYDGNEHVIKNMMINRHSDQYQGLFGYNDGVIINLGVIDASVNDNEGRAGILAGINNTGYIKNCHSTGIIQTSSVEGKIGGLCGENNKTVENSFSSARVTSSGDNNGGLIGISSGNEANIINCFASGQVSGRDNTGGLAGAATSYCTIKKSYSCGSVSGQSYVGGLSGVLSHNCILENSYSSSAVTGQGNYIGGLAGFISDMSTGAYCYSTGNVSAQGTSVGGLIGYVDDIMNIAFCYWDKLTSGLNNSSAGIGLTTDQMLKQINFLSWDFNNIWSINENITYPYLKWQGQAGLHNYSPGYTYTLSAEEKEIFIYPNPFNSHFILSNSENVSKVVITSLAGRLLVEINNYGSEQMIINTDGLLTGVYLVSIYSKNNKEITRKVLRY